MLKCIREADLVIKGQDMRYPSVDGTVLSLECIRVYTLAVILHYSKISPLGKTFSRLHVISLLFLRTYRYYLQIKSLVKNNLVDSMVKLQLD